MPREMTQATQMHERCSTNDGIFRVYILCYTDVWQVDKILHLPLCIKMQLMAPLTPNVNYLILFIFWDNHMGLLLLLLPLQTIVQEVVNNKHINVL